MNTALWITAGILAALFTLAGLTKLLTPREKLVDKLPWAKEASDTQVKLIGAAEVAGAIGLILPAAVDVVPALVAIAAICLAVTMAGAVATHLKLREGLIASAPAVVRGLLCLGVAYGRLGPYPF